MTLIRNGTVVEFDPPQVRRGLDILIEGTTIHRIGSKIELDDTGGKPEKIIDASDKLVFPGIVCSHHHYYSGLSRGIMAGIGPTPDFVSILRNLWWRLDRAIDEEILYASGLVCSLDALRAGTTSVIDHHASPSFITGSLETIKRAYEKTGLRGTTCYEVTDRNGTRGMKQGVDENVAFAKRIDREKAEGRWSGLMEAHIGGHAPNTLSEESLELLAGAVRDTGRGLHLHVAEDRYDVSHSHAVYGRDIMARLDDHGLLNEKTILVHGLYLSAEEIGLLNERDGFLVHNPRSNMNNGVGYDHRLPLVKNLALGTDGIGGDMFEEIKHAYFKHKDAGGVWWPGDFLKILAAGNRILERNFGTSFGRIEAGYTADLVIASYDSPTPIVPENIAGHLVFGMNGSTVETVMVNGSVVMENRQFPLDVATIYSDARAQAGRLWARMESIAP